MDRDFFNNIYNDFYGNTGEDINKKTNNSEDLLKKAHEALNEADALFKETTLITQQQIEELSKQTSELSSSTFQNSNYMPKSSVPEAEENMLTPDQSAPSSSNTTSSTESEEDPMEQLESLVGLASIKHDVKELMNFVKIQKLREDQGLKTVPISLHLVFTGNPGTGKTTVARIIAKLYKQIGVLSKGQLIEVDRSGLVAGFVGQTAIKTQEQIQSALGGVLFIDEAYALSGGDQDTFGLESINTILKAMEDHRKDFVVIVAGYTKPMEKFINSNPGLKSRFNKYIEFTDYSIDELEKIFEQNCKKYDYVLDEEIRHQIRALIISRQLANTENFANAREVRNLFEAIITNQATRIAALENPTPEELRTITISDLKELMGTGISDTKEKTKATDLDTENLPETLSSISESNTQTETPDFSEV